ncbi:MAG: hypothetical protein GY729_03800 [Desulfobacteraceae bacterium]|nr:hypothetical protein [Desulfobacteraceae bacterium]
MNDLYFDTKLDARQSRKQLEKRGLLEPGINLEDLGIVGLVTGDYDFDTDLYSPIDSGQVEIRADDKAYVIYEKEKRTSDAELGFDIRQVLTDKVNEKRESIFVSGIDFTFDGNTHTLQTRGVDDLLNWSTLLTEAAQLPVDTSIEIRTELDETLILNAGDIVSLLQAGLALRKSVLSASWTIKDNISNAVTDDDAFDVYEDNIENGWPDKSPIVIS